MDIRLIICFPGITCYKVVHSIPLEGSVSQNLDLGPSLYFMTKNGKPFSIFSKLFFKIG